MTFPSQFWVCGTDTGIGKTLVSAMLVHALKARYWKPVQTGTKTDSDTRDVGILSGCAAEDLLPERYTFSEPLSPHAAAALEGTYINPGEIQIPKPDGRPLVIETAGGLLVPYNDETLQLDVIERSGLPVVLVAANKLGTINHTLLSLLALNLRKIPVVGIVLSGPPSSIHKEAIERFSGIKILAEIPQLSVVSPVTVQHTAQRHFGGLVVA
jgi:dethiobiotin synthase